MDGQKRGHTVIWKCCVKKEKQDGNWKKKKHLFIFLADLQIPVKECLQYDSKIKIPTTECGENVIFLLCLFLQL